MVASDRSSAELAPKLNLGYRFFGQRGRDGLASIDQHFLRTSAVLPIGDENEFVEVGYQNVTYNPTLGRTANGNIPFFRVQKKALDNLFLGYAQVNAENFRNGFQDRPTFDTGFFMQHTDTFRTRGSLYLENVAQNGESIRQDIYRYGLTVGADFNPTRTWAFGGTYRFGRYSDENNLNQLDLYNEVLLTLAPKQLKAVLLYTLYGYSEQTRFAGNGQAIEPNIVGAVHPYFSPNSFNMLQARLEYTQWLSRDYFTHSNQTYFSLQYGISSDDRLEVYHNPRALFVYEPNSSLTLGVDASAQLSSVYRNVGVNLFMQYRFH